MVMENRQPLGRKDPWVVQAPHKKDRRFGIGRGNPFDACGTGRLLAELMNGDDVLIPVFFLNKYLEYL